MFNAGNGLRNFGYGGGIGTAYIALATLTKGSTWYQCHMLLHKKLFGKFLRGKAGGGYIWEDIEGSLWLKAL